MEPPKTDDAPSFREKIISSANWGMLGGFWVELPLLCTFFLKSHMGKSHPALDWQKLNDWSMKLVLPSTVAGVVYGWNQPNRDEAKLQKKIERIERRLDSNEDGIDGSAKSWTTTEQHRATDPESGKCLPIK